MGFGKRNGFTSAPNGAHGARRTNSSAAFLFRSADARLFFSSRSVIAGCQWFLCGALERHGLIKTASVSLAELNYVSARHRPAHSCRHRRQEESEKQITYVLK